jgi:hypothetical protein
MKKVNRRQMPSELKAIKIGRKIKILYNFQICKIWEFCPLLEIKYQNSKLPVKLFI